MAAPADPYVRLRLHDDAIAEAVIDGPAVAWMSIRNATRRPSGRSLGAGDDGPAAVRERWGSLCGSDAPRMIRALVELDSRVGLDGRGGLDGVTVPAGIFGLLPPGLTSPDPGHWSLWELSDDAHAVPGRARLLDPADDRIRPLLMHSPSAHVFPGDRPAQWAGIVEGDDLLAVAARIDEPNGFAHVVSVCTDPRARGRRLAQQAIGLLIEQARSDGCRGVMLEMYASNDPARRAYLRMGFAEVGQYMSGLLYRGVRPA
ncbi:MAG: GNAT family N-acetyltransferase [Actinomycetales bacterium]|nr:GNAT family N-acetyltransferase [Actinomycetales bacterium]